MTYEQMCELIESIENCDENIDALQKAAEMYCSNYDLCEGYKHALRMCLDDQYQNHRDEQMPDDLDELEKILTQ